MVANPEKTDLDHFVERYSKIYRVITLAEKFKETTKFPDPEEAAVLMEKMDVIQRGLAIAMNFSELRSVMDSIKTFNYTIERELEGTCLSIEAVLDENPIGYFSIDFRSARYGEGLNEIKKAYVEELCDSIMADEQLSEYFMTVLSDVRTLTNEGSGSSVVDRENLMTHFEKCGELISLGLFEGNDSEHAGCYVLSDLMDTALDYLQTKGYFNKAIEGEK